MCSIHDENLAARVFAVAMGEQDAMREAVRSNAKGVAIFDHRFEPGDYANADFYFRLSALLESLKAKLDPDDIRGKRVRVFEATGIASGMRVVTFTVEIEG